MELLLFLKFKINGMLILCRIVLDGAVLIFERLFFFNVSWNICLKIAGALLSILIWRIFLSILNVALIYTHRTIAYISEIRIKAF